MYVRNGHAQDDLLKQLVLIETRDGGWTQAYAELSTNTRWLLYYQHGGLQGGGDRVLRKEVVPEKLSDWLRECFTSGKDDDVQGLAWDLASNPEQWLEILDWLEANFRAISAAQSKLFVENLGSLQPVNRRATLGIPYDQVIADDEFFKALARRATALRQAA